MNKYNIIYADPPWQFNTHSKKGLKRSPESHYQTMSIDAIKRLPIKEIAADDSILFMWLSFPHLNECIEVAEAWGFTYKTVGFVWVKENRKSAGLFTGLGYWTRANAEICIIATRGRPKRVNAGVHQVVISPVEEHSRKPDIVRNRIVDLMGDLPRIELFARQPHPRWDVWGNEVKSSIKLEDIK